MTTTTLNTTHLLGEDGRLCGADHGSFCMDPETLYNFGDACLDCLSLTVGSSPSLQGRHHYAPRYVSLCGINGPGSTTFSNFLTYVFDPAWGEVCCPICVRLVMRLALVGAELGVELWESVATL